MSLLVALGIPAAAAAIAFVYFWNTLDTPTAPIVVVDRRTMHLAQRRISEAIDADDLARANAGVTALIGWARYEIRTCARWRSRHRAVVAAALEQAELRKAEINEQLGLPGYTV